VAHESHRAIKEEWLTPQWLLQRLGDFDLDPCAPHATRRPWPTAAEHFSIEDNGLAKPWHGRVWLNPPYGSKMGIWMARLADHGNGLGLIPSRTETAAFFDAVWDKADAVLFFRGRIKFHHANGTKAKTTMTAPHLLVAYGTDNVEALANCKDLGCFIKLGSTAQRSGDDHG
jgi:DNA N-6-adenine-methyltransferase (Dam)